jgi:hypothetical protein
MKWLTIFRTATALLALWAAIAVTGTPAGAVAGPTSASVQTDGLKISLSVAGETESEPDCEGDTGYCDAVIIISEPPAKDVTLHFATLNGSALAGQDFNGVLRATLVIPAGRSSAKARVTIRPDRIMTQPEFFYVRIFEPSVGEIVTSQRRMLIPLP